eukprot:SAG11_NODE_26504_length_344_cov_0.844898_1_plen_114_part_11
MAFYIGEHVLGASGVLSTVAFGIYLAKKAPYAMSEEVRHSVHVVFSQIAHFTETHIFVLAGMIISKKFILSYDELTEDGRLFSAAPIEFHILMSIALYTMLHFIRAMVLGLFLP